jgi:hypothetical protein
MDHTPTPGTHQPGRWLQLMNMPTGVHHMVFNFLDDLDGTALGLTSRYFYSLQRQRVGSVSLKMGRAGLNDLEWCWRLSGDLLRCQPHDVLRKTFPLRTDTGSIDVIFKYQELSRYRLRGR